MIFALMIFALLLNIYFSKVLPHIETAALWTHITLFIVVLVVLTVMAPTKSSNAEVWTLFLNEGGYESKGLSFFVGLITPVFAFSGVDGAVHMSEEIRNCSRVLPWALMGTFNPSPRLFGTVFLNLPQRTD
jgi:choline transport protein